MNPFLQPQAPLSVRFRALVGLMVMGFGFTLISLQLVRIQLIGHQHWLDLSKTNVREEIIQPLRGTIFDSENQVLVQTQQVYDIHLDGLKLTAPDTELPQLADILHNYFTLSDLQKRFKPQERYIPLADGVDDPTIVSSLKALPFARALRLSPHDRRIYLNDELAAHVLGYCDPSGMGLSGVEKMMNAKLTGLSGKRYFEVDRRQQEIALFSNEEVPAVDGYNVKLTINSHIQHAAEDELDDLVKKYEPDAAYILVLQPQTGEILAMASRPTFNPNQRSTYQPELLKNRCLLDSVEPGSIFKIVPLAAALNEHKLGLNTEIFCENGAWSYNGKTLRDDEPKGTQPVRDCLTYSSNIGCAKIAVQFLGQDVLFDYISRFGFGRRTGLMSDGTDFQGESAGLVHPVSTWSGISITRVPIGQEISVTPLQMTQAMCVIANGGRLVEPRLVSEVTDTNNRVMQSFPPKVIRSVISSQTARLVTEALEDVVTRGTGRNAAVPGYLVAGKTGTAQKVESGRYNHLNFVSSFIGFLPAEDPQFVALVMVNNPKTVNPHEIYGAQVAAPAFSHLAAQVAQILNIAPDQTITQVVNSTVPGGGL